MKKEEKKQYERPNLTVVTFKTEKGFATSNPSQGYMSGNDEPEAEKSVSSDRQWF